MKYQFKVRSGQGLRFDIYAPDNHLLCISHAEADAKKICAAMNQCFAPIEIQNGDPCPNCNPTGVFNYGDDRCQICHGTAYAK